MKRWIPLLALALGVAFCAPASGQYAVYTVTGAAVATGSQFFPLQQAFDSQPTWDSQAGATGGGTSGGDAPYYAGRWGYIDFGPNWANVHIVQTWTLYRTWSGGNQTPYANMWWDDDIDTTNDNGAVESTLQFNSGQNVPNVNYVQWIRDTDASSSPVVPQRRYLLLHAPNPMTNRAKEYAIIVQTNFAPTADAGDDAVVTLAAGANLDGTVSDDGMPNPPGALTTTWTKTSGPGTVTFGNASAVDTTAGFSSAGTYVLRLTASDSSLQAYDEVTIEVYGEGIVTPTAAGAASGSQYFPLNYAFDGQPTWDATNQTPTGGGTGSDAPAYSGRWGYIDFGANWQDIRITETWTMYRTSSGGNQTPYADAWWDDDNDIYNDNGMTEAQVNFNSAQGLSTGGTTPWIKDMETAAPIMPQRRYLILHAPNPQTNRAKEYAIVGYTYAGSNTAPTVSAGENIGMTLADTAQLDGSVSDDGLPGAATITWSKISGPGTVTFDDANSAATTATFSAEGGYILRLSANDGEVTAYDEVAVVVNPAPPSLALAEPQVFDFGSMTLVDEVICGDPGETHTLYESASGVSTTETILGSACRVLPGTTAEPSYFGYVIGQGCGLEAGKAYVLVVEYPEDESRSMIVGNRGCETNQGFHTGTTLGDCLTPTYTNSNPESLNYGFSNNYRKWQQLFHLHDRFPGIDQPRGEADRPYLPADGFYVVICQFCAADDPTSAGAAVRRIALYEAPSLEEYTQPLAELPAGLPKRHLFFREEMADGVISSTTATQRGVATDTAWYEYKARLEKFLGMNTFAKDLLEFGHCQGWDVSYYGGASSDWFNRSSMPNRWEQILVMLAQGGYGLDVLPYYEYAGGDGVGDAALGKKRVSRPLGDTNGDGQYTITDPYTHIYWSENIDIDVSDPTAVTDASRMLEQTMTILKDGDRPIPITVAGNGNATWKPGYWGYIDFGANWQNVRICQTWTQSRLWHGGNATPFSAVYWHTTYAGFSGGTVPQGAIQENTVNFLTQYQINGANRWAKDVDVTSSPITPQARYLVMRAANPITDCMEFLVVGYLNGQGTTLDRIAVTAGSADGYPMQNMFDNQTEFNHDGAVNFVGAWFRPRQSAIPIGFDDPTRARYSADRGIGAVTRADLTSNSTLHADYESWWLDERKTFFNAMRDYLQTNVRSDAVFLYTWDPSEDGVSHPSDAPDVITDDVTSWGWKVTDPMSYDDAVSGDLHYEAMTLPAYNWGSWEWPHSIPRGDPLNYQSNDDVMMEYVFNKMYTVADPGWLDAYRTNSGLACIYHYSLNEDCMTTSGDVPLVGYFVSNMELAGPYCMLPEARAVANGDPYYIGYLSSNSYSRGFPGYVREFNANYLALPALTSTVVANAASDSDVVVRRINTASNGTWLAIVNTGFDDSNDVVITLPVSGTVTDAVTGQTISVSNGTITLDLWPGQLRSVHVAN